MANGIDIRLVKTSDTDELLAIYTPIILETASSFETEVPSRSVFQKRIESYSSKSPWLVAIKEQKVIGYAYATDHRSRQAYQWNQEVTVYVHSDYKRQGVASQLYAKLLELLREMGFRKALAVITLPNDPSIEFHKNFGFKHIGEMKNIGYKLDAWHDTSWWDLELADSGTEPAIIKSIASIEHLS